MRRWWPAATAWGLSLSCIVGLGGTEAAVAASHDDRRDPVVVVLDTSGSMDELTSTDSIRIDAARGAVQALVYPMRRGDLYGLISYPGGASVGGCSNGRIVTRLGALDHDKALSQVRSLSPDGNTPTAPALRHAAAELRAAHHARGTIVLVSDGESNCGGDPCEASRDLRRDGFEVVVNTVGFDISGEGEAELRCIADATGGRYYPADGSTIDEQMAKANGGYLDLAVKMPPTIPVVTGTSSTRGTSVPVTVTNTGSKTATDVRVSLSIGTAGRVLVVRPVRFLGNLAPGASLTRVFTVRPDQTYEPDPLPWTVTATAVDAPPAKADGEVRMSTAPVGEGLGPLLRGADNVVVMGDSYSSGEGTGHYSAGSSGDAGNWCHRSSYAYGPVLFGERQTAMIACSGAVSRDLTAQQKSHEAHMVPQLMALRAQAVGPDSPDVVLLTLGGNDIGFAQIVETCTFKSNCQDQRLATDGLIGLQTQTVDEYYTERARAVSADLVKAYRGIDAAVNDSEAVAARHGRVVPIVVLPYVRVVPETRTATDAPAGCFLGFNGAEVHWMNKIVDTLNQSIRWSVGQLRADGRPFHYVDDVVGAFQPNHTMCEKTESFAVYLSKDRSIRLADLRVLDPERKQELVHPNSDGHEAIARAVATWSRSEAPVDAEPAPDWHSRTQSGPSWWQTANQKMWGTAVPGGSIEVEAGGYAEGTTVVFTIRSRPRVLGTAVADVTGRARLATWLPDDLETGTHQVEASGLARDGRLKVDRQSIRLHRPGYPIALSGLVLGVALLIAGCAVPHLRRRGARRRMVAS